MGTLGFEGSGSSAAFCKCKCFAKIDGPGLYGFFNELSNKIVLIKVGVVLLLHLKLSLEAAVKLCAEFIHIPRHHSPHLK